jgi:hypothetical protein
VFRRTIASHLELCSKAVPATATAAAESRSPELPPLASLSTPREALPAMVYSQRAESVEERLGAEPAIYGARTPRLGNNFPVGSGALPVVNAEHSTTRESSRASLTR